MEVGKGIRAGTGMVHGRKFLIKGGITSGYISIPTKRKAAKLLQQFSGTPRFEKRRLHLRTV